MKEPVLITYHDRPRFVLMTIQEYDRLRGRRQTATVTRLPESLAQRIEALSEGEEPAAEDAESAPAHGPHS